MVETQVMRVIEAIRQCTSPASRYVRRCASCSLLLCGQPKINSPKVRKLQVRYVTKDGRAEGQKSPARCSTSLCTRSRAASSSIALLLYFALYITICPVTARSLRAGLSKPCQPCLAQHGDGDSTRRSGAPRIQHQSVMALISADAVVLYSPLISHQCMILY